MSEETNEKDSLIVTSKVKAYIKSKGFMTSSDAVDGLNEKIYKMLDEALERTQNNKRTTVRSYDF
jgi:tRNA C32,U32 (ribose-2'-O)-methylase TrmJ